MVHASVAVAERKAPAFLHGHAAELIDLDDAELAKGVKPEFAIPEALRPHA